jgi:predicted unusual protein kinase regulating ubiquinone biosynthesis (AarF/ABC1/UbiB family)
MLGQEGFGGSLPRDFLEQISASVKRELDFGREKEFSDQIRVDVEARNAKRRHKVAIPDIYFASDDIMLEQRAAGISLRQFSDRRTPDMGGFVPAYGTTSERNIHATVATEAIAQLISTGNIHADLHPGNIFVGEQGQVTLIDLGMHERLNRQQRLDTIALITGLVTGNENYIKSTLRRFGWNLGEAKLNLERFKFADNTTALLNATHQSETPPPETVTSIIIAASKLGTYTSGFSNKELARMLILTVDKKEVPAIITNTIKAGGRELIAQERDANN